MSEPSQMFVFVLPTAPDAVISSYLLSCIDSFWLDTKNEPSPWVESVT